ncbi:YdaS family helix-turn-helix protein [Serratia fonticola]
MKKNALLAAISSVGSIKLFAKNLGISQQSVCKWKNKRRGIVPHGRVLDVFAISGVTPHELRPDLYPNPTDGLPKNFDANQKPNQMAALE